MENTINRLAVAADAFSKLQPAAQNAILELMRTFANKNKKESIAPEGK